MTQEQSMVKQDAVSFQALKVDLLTTMHDTWDKDSLPTTYHSSLGRRPLKNTAVPVTCTCCAAVCTARQGVSAFSGILSIRISKRQFRQIFSEQDLLPQILVCERQLCFPSKANFSCKKQRIFNNKI